MSKIDIKLNSLAKFHDLGLLLLRIGIGLSFLILHGWGKITAGPEMWAGVGQAMPTFGIEGLAIFWGFLAALTESLGAILFLLGLFYRPASLALAFTMLTATIFHLKAGDGWSTASHAMDMFIIFLGMTLVGPGKYSVDK